MIQVNASYLELSGTNYEIGYRLGQIAAQAAANAQGPQLPVLEADDAERAMALFDAWCPGLTEEIEGYADALGIDPAKAPYYGMTFLRPNCSQLAVLPAKTATGHVLQARSYEMSYQLEDFLLARTSAAGRYTHLGTTIMGLGREEGINNKGLGVTMSSCGFPVGAMPGMRKPALRGLQFWAVIRALLENCENVNEALDYLADMPIAYNLNLIVSDKSGNAALFETLDGRKASSLIGAESAKQWIHATNHPHIDALAAIEPNAMANSVHRYEYIGRYVDGIDAVSADDLKKLLMGTYPQGLACGYHEEYFGTTKSVIIDVSAGTLDLCWGGLKENGWRSFDVRKSLAEATQSVSIAVEKAPEGFFRTVNLQG